LAPESNSNWKKLLGFRNIQKKLKKYFPCRAVVVVQGQVVFPKPIVAVTAIEATAVKSSYSNFQH
jgi:hypothetical protein